MKDYKGFLIDRDGVLIFAKDGCAVPGSIQWMRELTRKNLPYLVATNHTTSSPAAGAMQLKQMGFPVTRSHMHTPLSILGRYFSSQSPGKVYARGTPELLDHLAAMGAQLTDRTDAETVILGFDQTMDYKAVKTIIASILENNAQLIALHENRLFKSSGGDIDPGLGAWVRAIEYATGHKALIVGKPSLEYYRTALEIIGIPPAEAVMISDDPLGDLTGARKAGIDTIFVLSGKYTDQSILDQLEPDMQPDFILNSIRDILL